MIHGGNLHDAKALFPEAPEPWIDLSTGINPHMYPVAFADPAIFARLPSRQSVEELERIAARAYGVADHRRVAAAPGSQALIEWLARMRPKSRVAILGPTYNEHAACWRREGHSCWEVETLTEALSGTPDVIIVVNPNNPDGRSIGRDALKDGARHLAKNGGWLVIDEAFADLEEDVSVAPDACPGAIVLRSFGKTYGLAGIRLGFAIAEPAIAGDIRRRLGLWALSGPALSIGAAALQDRNWLKAQKRALGMATRDLDQLLQHQGFDILGGTRLFRLARHPEAARIFDSLAQAGIWVRKFPHDADLLRFGIPAADAFPRLNAAFKQGLSA